jgi:hypothetical protein
VSSAAVVTAQSAVAGRLNRDAAKMGALWANYHQTHNQIRKTDDLGNWDLAVRQAIGSDPQSANATFNAFDSGSAAALASSSRAVSDTLNAPRTWLPFAAWLSLLVGVAAAVSAWWGVSLRLEEYR